MTTYTHKLTNETYKPVKNGSQLFEGEVVTGVFFTVKETGQYKFMSDHQIMRLLK